MFLYCGNTVLSLVSAEGCTSGEALTISVSQESDSKVLGSVHD
jgi:hypothetical protein